MRNALSHNYRYFIRHETNAGTDVYGVLHEDRAPAEPVICYEVLHSDAYPREVGRVSYLGAGGVSDLVQEGQFDLTQDFERAFEGTSSFSKLARPQGVACA